MESQCFNCWRNPDNLGVGCAASCGPGPDCYDCGRMSGHYWTGSCDYAAGGHRSETDGCSVGEVTVPDASMSRYTSG
jgi:hypothetical protein